MANYTDLANLAVGTGGLPSGTTVTALRDNPIAIAGGAAGAPRISGRAAMSIADYIALYPLVVGVGNIPIDPSAYSGSFVERTTTSTSFQSCGSITATLFSGNARFRATQVARGDSNGTGTNTTRFLKNGVVVQTWTLSQSVSADRSEIRSVDISVAIGDQFEWQVSKSGTASASQTTSPFPPDGDDEVVRVGLPIKASEL